MTTTRRREGGLTEELSERRTKMRWRKMRGLWGEWRCPSEEDQEEEKQRRRNPSLCTTSQNAGEERRRPEAANQRRTSVTSSPRTALANQSDSRPRMPCTFFSPFRLVGPSANQKSSLRLLANGAFLTPLPPRPSPPITVLSACGSPAPPPLAPPQCCVCRRLRWTRCWSR